MMSIRAAACLALALAACAPVAPPQLPAPELSPGQAETLALVEANAGAARVLAAMRSRGLPLVPMGFSRVDLLAGSPGIAWRAGQEHLHIHVYRGPAGAQAALARFVEVHDARRNLIDWAGRPHLFLCGSAVALYLGTNPQALSILTNQCGEPVRLVP